MGPFRDTGLFSGARFGVFETLCNHADEFGECFPSYEAVALGARCERRTAIKEVDWLVEHGCVEKLQGAARPKEKQAIARRANVYRVNMALVNSVYTVVCELKKMAGRNAAKRYRAIAALAAWAEKIIEDEGCESLLGTLKIIHIEGGLTSLWRNCNSDQRSPSEAAKGVIEIIEGVLTTPKPSIEPSEEPSPRARGAAAPDGAPPPDAKETRGADREGGQRAETETSRSLTWKRGREAIIEWLLDGSIDRMRCYTLHRDFGAPKPPAYTPDGEEAAALALAVTPSLRRTVVSAFEWVERWIAGIDPKNPTPPYGLIEQNLRQFPNDASRARRLAQLRQSLEGIERQDDQDADDQDPDREPHGREPSGDHQDAEDAA